MRPSGPSRLTPAGIRRAIQPLFEHGQLLMIAVSTVLVMAGQGVVAPILPLYATEFDVPTAVIGLTLSFFALARLILNVPMGILADRYGRRLLLVSGPLVTAVGMIGSGFAGDIYQLLAWRFVAGAGSAMYMTAAQIYLADISTAGNRARFIGVNQGALLLGVSIGPGLGGLIAEGWGLSAPFHVVGVGALVAALYCYVRLPETRHLALEQEEAERVGSETGAEIGDETGEPPPPKARAWLTMIRSRDFLGVSLVTMGIFFTRSASRQTLMPLLAVARLGMSPGVLGAIFTLASVVNMFLLFPSAIAADRLGRKWVIVPSGVIVAAGLLLMAGANSYLLFIAASIVLAIGTAAAGPAPAAYVADIAPPKLRGLGMGLQRSSGDLGFVIGPPLLGAIADATSFGWGLTVNAVLMLAATLFFAVAARETLEARRQQPAAIKG